MPTLEELKTEDCFRDEIVPTGLRTFAHNVREFFGSSISSVGTIGDHRHLSGYHRSRRWILESRFCENRTYSVVETVGNRTGGNENWISGCDIVASEARSKLFYRRLTFAKQQGRLPQIRQILLEQNPWHIHISIDRAHPNDDHTTLFNILTGQDTSGGAVTTFSVTMPVIKMGDSGEAVGTAQALLIARGFPTKIDNDFGPHTDLQTRALQRAAGAEAVDGIWGPETWPIGMTGRDAA